MYSRLGLAVVVIAASLMLLPEAYAQNYHLGPGDILEISVWKDENLSRELVVPPDYVISFPLVGDIYVRQTTVGDLRKRVATKISEYIPDPSVTVILKNINSLKAYVIGKVNKPGAFDIDLETSVMQVLSMAGGLNPFAAEDDIYILRKKDDSSIVIPFDYSEVKAGEDLKQNINLKRGDVVVVP